MTYRILFSLHSILTEYCWINLGWGEKLAQKDIKHLLLSLLPPRGVHKTQLGSQRLVGRLASRLSIRSTEKFFKKIDSQDPSLEVLIHKIWGGAKRSICRFLGNSRTADSLETTFNQAEKCNKCKLVQWGSICQVWSSYPRHQNQLGGLIKNVLGSPSESTVFASLGVRSGQVHFSKAPQWLWCPAELNFCPKGTRSG